MKKPGSANYRAFFMDDRQKKADRQVGSEYEKGLLGVVRVVVFAAIAFSAVTVKVQAVVGQTNAMTCGNFALTQFDGIITEFDHFAAIQANKVIVVVLLGQFENRLAAFEIMTGNNARVIELVQHTIHGCQPNLFTHVDKTFVEVFRTDMVIVWPLKHFKDF